MPQEGLGYWLDQLLNGLVLGNIYALLASGLALIFGVAHLINFAHGSVFMAGAYVGWLVTVRFDWPLYASLPAAVAAAGLLGFLVERFAVKPFRASARIAPLLATIGVSFILNSAAELLFTPNPQAFAPKLPVFVLTLGNVRIGFLDLLILSLSLASGILLFVFLSYTKSGQALRAAAQDPDAASQMGVRVDVVNGLAFSVASALGGLGGVLVGIYYNSISPTMGVLMGLKGFIACILGGISGIPASMAGGLVLGILESVGVGLFGSSARNLFAFSLLLLLLLLRPQGLFRRRGGAAREPLTGTFLPQARAIRLGGRLGIPLVAAALIFPLIMTNAYVLQMLAGAWVYALFAVSLTLVAGTTGIVSLGHAGLMSVGAYSSGLLAVKAGFPFPAAVLCAGFFSAAAGMLLLSPAVRLKGHYISIATLALGEIVNQIILNWDGVTQGALGLGGIPVPRIAGREIASVEGLYYLNLGLLLAGAVVVALVIRSPLGRTLRSIREDETASRSLGIRVEGYKTLAFALSSFFAGLSGALTAHMYSYINFETFNSNVSILALTMVILGGLGQVWGAVFGAVFLIGLPEALRPIAEYRWLVYGLLLIMALRYRPQGALGTV